MTSLDVAVSNERAGVVVVPNAFSLPLLLPAEEEGAAADGEGAGDGAVAIEESESEARIAWMVSRTSDPYSLPSRDSSSAFREDSGEAACCDAPEVAEGLGLAWGYTRWI